jgi:ketosteroid isomerase-like protein
MRANSPEEIHAALAEAFNNGDLDGSVELHEDDAVIIVPPEGLKDDREEGDPRGARARLRPQAQGHERGSEEARQ